MPEVTVKLIQKCLYVLILVGWGVVNAVKQNTQAQKDGIWASIYDILSAISMLAALYIIWNLNE